MPALDPGTSYYEATALPRPPRPPVDGGATCDVCVVGGGLTGLSAALDLARRGYDTLVLEQATVGAGASGRNGGHVMPGFSGEDATLLDAVGPDAARTLFDTTREAVALVEERVRHYAIPCDLRHGHLTAALKPRHMRALEEHAETWRERYGYEGLALLDREQARRKVASDRYVGGLYDPAALHLHPLNYTLGLARAAEAEGARIAEHTRVHRVETHGRPPVVHTDGGAVRAGHVLLCGNAYGAGLGRPLRRTVMPVGTYIVATEQLGAHRARALIPGDCAVADAKAVLDYFRLSHDHRLLFGGAGTYSGRRPRDPARALRPLMLRVFPGLADAAITHAWGGHVAITLDRLPHFGRLAPEVYFAQGFSGHGVALAGLAGRVMAEAVAGTAERFDLYARLPHRPFPGGPLLRTPALVLAMAWHRLRDAL